MAKMDNQEIKNKELEAYGVQGVTTGEFKQLFEQGVQVNNALKLKLQGVQNKTLAQQIKTAEVRFQIEGINTQIAGVEKSIAVDNLAIANVRLEATQVRGKAEVEKLNQAYANLAFEQYKTEHTIESNTTQAKIMQNQLEGLKVELKDIENLNTLQYKDYKYDYGKIQIESATKKDYSQFRKHQDSEGDVAYTEVVNDSPTGLKTISLADY